MATTQRRQRPTRLAALTLALTLTLALGGCGSDVVPTVVPTTAVTPAATAAATASGPTPTPVATAVPCDPSAPMPSAVPTPKATDPDAALHQAIEAKVEEIRGLTPSTPVNPAVLDATGLCALLRQVMANGIPPDLMAASERAYKQLLLIPQDASLLRLNLDLYAGQVIGVYDQYAKQLYVVAGTGITSPLGRITYAHEFTHALQDQAFDLKKLQGDAKDQGDRGLAITALVEGDAVLAMSLWAQVALTPAELVEAAGATDPAASAALDAAPAILREPLLFAYTSGMRVAVAAYQNAGGYGGVDALFANPPVTTEQVMHAEKLAAGEPARTVAVPAQLLGTLGAGWKIALEDTLGEFQLGILVRTGDPKAGTDPAVGWGGDRLALLEGPNGARATVIDTVWDTATAASDFFAAVQPYIAKLQAAGRSATVAMPADDRVVIAVADSDTTLGRLAAPYQLAQ
jgi:hypothetical protein